MAVGYAIRVFSLLQVWLKMWATKSKNEANDVSMALCLLSGKFDRCSKQKLKHWHGETAKFSQGVVPSFIIGIYYWNDAQPQGSTFAEALRLPRSHRTIQWNKLHLSDWNDRAFPLSESYLRVVRQKVCDGGLELTAEPFTTFPQQTSHVNIVRIVTRLCYHTFYKADILFVQ